MDVRLAPFDEHHAAAILGWARSPAELDAWSSVSQVDGSAFGRWHAEPGTHPYVLLAGERLAGYGEVWADAEADEAELGRIIVAPKLRGHGVGRRLVALLVAEARLLGFEEIWLRVVPSNAPALACYTAAGFVRATPAQEADFNRGQPREYVWMRLGPS